MSTGETFQRRISMKKRKIGLAVVALLLLIAGVVWAFRIHADNQVARVRDMQKEMFAGGKPPQPEQFEKFRKEMDHLSPSQREEVGKGMFENMQRQMNKTIDEYFNTPPEKQNECLDRQIKEADANMKRMMASAPPPPPANANSGSAPPARPNPSPEARNQRRNQMLDHMPPGQRAKFTAYFAAVAKRRAELGLPAFPGPPRPGAR
jgi:hypothetical protein